MEVVALLTESVDRNNDLFVEMSTDFVALLTESVDRNRLGCWCYVIVGKRSLSSRRAWIEIPRPTPRKSLPWVALLTESVDRNFAAGHFEPAGYRSLSSRRAWIEMQDQLFCDAV